MDELKTLIKELEHQPPESLARQRLRLLEEATRKPRWVRFPLAGRAARGLARTPGLPGLSGRRLALSGAVAATAIVASLVAPTLIGSTASAYAVSKSADGTISVQINEFKDSKELEADLRALGISAVVVDYLPKGKLCKEPRARYRPGEESLRVSRWNSGPDGAISFTLYPDRIKPGQTLVVAASFNNPDDGGSASFRLADGPVAACQPVDKADAFSFAPE